MQVIEQVGSFFAVLTNNEMAVVDDPADRSNEYGIQASCQPLYKDPLRLARTTPLSNQKDIAVL